MNYYLSTITQKVITDKDLKVLESIYGNIPFDLLDQYSEPPSIIEMLKRNSWQAAITRYMEMYPNVEYNRACRAVAIMKKDITRFSKKEEK